MNDRGKTKQQLKAELSALRKSEERLRLITDSITDFVLLVDTDGAILYENSSHKGMLGYEHGERIGRSVFEYVHPDDLAYVKRAFEESAASTLQGRITYRLRNKSGQYRWVETNGKVTYNRDGQVNGAVISSRDIDDRKKMEETLRASENLYRTIFDSTGTSMVIVDEDMTIVLVNAELETITGYFREEIEGKKWTEFIPPVERHRMMKYYELRKTNPDQAPAGYEFRFIDKRGNEKCAYVNAAVIPETKKIVASFIDITEKKGMEEALRESEEKYRLVVENVRQIISVAQDGLFKFVNPMMVELSGCSAEELINKPITDFIHPDDRSLILENHRKRLRGEEFPAVYSFRVIDKEGHIRWMEINTVKITWEGKPATLSFANDITGRKHAERALRESEERFRMLTEHVPIGISLMKPDLTFEYFNPRFSEIFGYSPEDLPDKQTWFAKAYPDPDYRQEVVAAWEEDLQQDPEIGKIGARTFKVRCKNGMDKLIHLRTVIVSDGSHLATYEDVSEFMAAEKAVKESEKKYREFVEFLPQSVFEFDKNGTFTFANRFAFNAFGYTEADFKQGINVLDVIVPEDRERASENIKERLKKELQTGTEYTMLRKDGNTFPAIIYSTQIKNENNPTGARGIVFDITDRKHMEEALKKSEAHFRAVIESARDSVFIKDCDFKYTLANPAMKHLVDIPVSELIGKTDKDIFNEEFIDHVKDVDMRVLGGEIVEEECIRSVSGEQKTFHIIKTPMYDDAGSIIGLCGIARDVTETQKMEAQLLQSQKMEAIGTLAGGIAHDFNNLLMGIQGNTSLMLLDLATDHPHYEKLKNIETQVKSGADLTRQLLGFARGGRYEIKPTNINAVVKKTSTIFGRTRKEISIDEKLYGDIWTVEADPGQLEQVLLNIYINAWQAMPTGGKIIIETKNTVFSDGNAKFHNIQPGRHVMISVTDTGIGMDKETRQRIFDPFFTTKEMGRGIGLGLASAYGIVRGHGGIITVHSVKNMGSTFTIYLPASDKKALHEKTSIKQILRGTETILLVDDENMIINVTKEILESLGYKVLTAFDGQEAVEIFSQDGSTIDLVVLDLIMPGMGGGETFDMMRNMNPDIKIILSSGYSIDGMAKEIMDRGCNAFLQKPFDLTELSQKIREVLDIRT